MQTKQVHKGNEPRMVVGTANKCRGATEKGTFYKDGVGVAIYSYSLTQMREKYVVGGGAYMRGENT